MKTNTRFRHIIIGGITLSIFCAVFLQGQLIDSNIGESNISACVSNSSAIITEVEVVKIFVEKIIDIVTLPSV